MAADEYGEIRGTPYEDASELALEEVYGTAVQLTTEQVKKVRGEDGVVMRLSLSSQNPTVVIRMCPRVAVSG